MNLEGKTFGKNGRYKLIAYIGGGGMAEVYRGYDNSLQREVAVKILREEYINDSDFIKRFRCEAQSAAKLIHPNIVNIFDVGVENNVYYIIMEYIKGETLKEKLQREEKFSITQALNIALQIAQALKIAHMNNIVHCDIKPHNILINEAEIVKVADFGIARAITSATLACTDTILGSVHYISPEQAKGISVNHQSDIYSLGIVLYEMLTGTVPFTGETPISIALKHIQEIPQSVKKVNNNISRKIAAIVNMSIEKEITARYINIEEFIEDIKTSLTQYKANNFKEDKETATKLVKIPKINNTLTDKKKEKGNIENNNRKKSQTFIIIAILFLSLIGFTTGVLLSYSKFFVNKDVVVADVKGKQLDIGENILIDQNLRVNIVETYSASIPIGTIISQNPEPGKIVKERQTVKLTVSKGKEKENAYIKKKENAYIIVPNLKGLKKEEAINILNILRLRLEKIGEVESYAIDSGKILYQDPYAGNRVVKGQKIQIIIGKENISKITVPNIIGKNKIQAMGILSSMKLKFGKINEIQSYQNANGIIINQIPAAGKPILSGSTIDIDISNNNTIREGINISYIVPNSLKQQRIKIIIFDNKGENIVYDNINKAGDIIKKFINTVGRGKYQIILNGNIVKEKDF